jgi:DNA-binding transcriptional MocR family regulator
VIHCNSLNKVLAPGFRVGWMLGGRWASRIEMLKYTASRFPEELTQSTLADYIASPAYDRHLKRLRKALHRSREAMAEAIASHFPDGTRLSLPADGLLLWLQLPEGVSGDASSTPRSSTASRPARAPCSPTAAATTAACGCLAVAAWTTRSRTRCAR